MTVAELIKELQLFASEGHADRKVLLMVELNTMYAPITIVTYDDEFDCIAIDYDEQNIISQWQNYHPAHTAANHLQPWKVF